MLEEFSFLGEETAYEIVVTNPNKIADMVSEIEVIIATPKPFAPKIPNSIETMTELVYTKDTSNIHFCVYDEGGMQKFFVEKF